jgi:hypothetical protein
MTAVWLCGCEGYDIKSKQIRIGDATCKGYDRADFIDVWKRYLPPSSDRSETSETSETSQEFQRLNVSVVSDAPLNVSDDVSDVSYRRAARNADKFCTVSHVSDVSLPGGDGGEGPAARGDNTRVTVREIRVPAIAAGIDDDLEEIDQRWRI